MSGRIGRYLRPAAGAAWRWRRGVIVVVLAIGAFALTAEALYVNMDVRPRLVLQPEPLHGKLVDGFSPDGRWLVTRSHEWHDREFHCVFQVWNVTIGREQARADYRFEVPEDGPAVALEKPEFSPDCRHVVVWWGDQKQDRKTLTLLDIGSGASKTFEATNVLFSPDGLFLALQCEQDGTTKCLGLVQMSTGQQRPFRARNLCFSPHGRQMAVVVEDEVTGRQTLQIVETTSARTLETVATSARVPFRANAFWGLQFVADGRLLAYGKNRDAPIWKKRRRRTHRNLDEQLTLWDIQTRKPQLEFAKSWQLAPDGKTLAVYHHNGPNGDWFSLWNVDSLHQVAQFDLGARWILFSQDNSKFGIVDNQTDSITTRDLSTGRVLSHITSYLNPNTNLFFQRFAYPREEWLPRFVFQQPNRANTEPKVRETATGREVISLPVAVAGKGPWFANNWYTFSPDENLLLLGQSGLKPTNWLQDQLVQWLPFLPAPEFETQHWIRCWSLPSAHEFPMLPGGRERFKIAADSGTLAAYCNDGTVKLWDLPPRKPLGLLLAWSSVPAALVLLFGWWRARRRKRKAAATTEAVPCGR